MLRNTTTLKENEKETKSESRLILQISNFFFFGERERESEVPSGEAKEDFSFFYV